MTICRFCRHELPASTLRKETCGDLCFAQHQTKLRRRDHGSQLWPFVWLNLYHCRINPLLSRDHNLPLWIVDAIGDCDAAFADWLSFRRHTALEHGFLYKRQVGWVTAEGVRFCEIEGCLKLGDRELEGRWLCREHRYKRQIRKRERDEKGRNSQQADVRAEERISRYLAALWPDFYLAQWQMWAARTRQPLPLDVQRLQAWCERMRAE